MKIGLIADIHSNIYGFRSVMEKLRSEKVDIIFCAGDMVGYYTFVNEVLDELRANSVECILGNHDAYLLGSLPCPENKIIKNAIEYTRKIISRKNLDYLKGIKRSFIEAKKDGLRINIYHGSPWNHFEEYVYPDYPNFDKFKNVAADVIIFGHTHRAFCKKIGDKLAINPGSCGQPRDDDKRAGCAIYDTKTRKISMIKAEYNAEKVCESIIANSMDRRLVDILKIQISVRRK